MIVIVIIAIVLLIVILFFSSASSFDDGVVVKKGSISLSDSDEAVIGETINYIEQVRMLYNGETHLNPDTMGWFQIIPVNENKDMYRPNSCIIMLRLLVYEDWQIPFILNTAQINGSSFGIFSIQNRRTAINILLRIHRADFLVTTKNLCPPSSTR